MLYTSICFSSIKVQTNSLVKSITLITVHCSEDENVHHSKLAGEFVDNKRLTLINGNVAISLMKKMTFLCTM